MSETKPETSPKTEEKTAREWLNVLSKYKNPSHARSFLEIGMTAVPLLFFWGLAYWSMSYSAWFALALSIPAGVFVVRLFLILHDCSHGSFFRRKKLNDWVGRVLGVFTMTPFDEWRHSHVMHHRTSGNLDKRGIGDIVTLTVREYKERSLKGKVLYRLYRHPITMFLLGPIYVFMIRHRLPDELTRASAKSWTSAMATNAGIAAVIFLIIFFFGLKSFLLIYLPMNIVAGAIGIWLFYVQHQFEETVWEQDEDWEVANAALYGSSHYDLPHPLKWLTANIGIHHVHHLYARIPFYRLGKVLREHPRLADIQRMTLLESFKCAKLQLWDENKRRLVSYAEARTA
ncbi:MAG: fatty acid desaturase [Acidimicrobiales bacterium]|nr:fatty acid desaturase [Hyphomonadaceae bacterium]RZV43391.1 MAG: fatty acid desaturase [Acidimicrobiales bacterium]